MKLRGKVIATGMVGVIVLIAISTLLFNHNYRLLEANADSVAKAYQVNEALDRSYTSMLSLAADLRYFVITGDSAYFENMDTDSILIRKELAHLQELLQKEKVEIVTLEKDYFALIESKLQFDHYVRITGLKHGLADAQKLIATGEGKKLLSRILEQRNLLTQAINMELAEREKRLYDQIVTNEAVALIGFALSIVSLTLLSYVLYRKIKVAAALTRVVKEKELTAHLQTIREEERKNISRIIHDELGQQLTGLKMDMTWISQQLSSESTAVMKKMDTMIELIDQTVLSVRRISSDLRPAMLDDLGLVAALQWMSRDFQERSGIKITFNTNSQDYLFKPEVATELYRIFQEALINVVRHSGATEVKSSLTLTGEKIYLSLSDNGKGFDPEKVKNKKALGLIGMRERAAMIHGTLEVHSDKQGTEVTVIIPIAEAKMIV
jgi:signal transduction histidine kinase